MRPMDKWIHLDRPMKIERTTSNDASSSCSMWHNLMLHRGLDGHDLKTSIHESSFNISR